MINRLSIKNYALIDSIDIEFDRNLNILTGETGAGKSIIMGALSLILGQRAEGRFFYNQDKKCIIEGYFDVSGYDLLSFFQENDLDYASEAILRREINIDGKSRAFINDTPVTLQRLKALGELLIDIHSQHATLQIGTADFQLLTLDSVAGNKDIRTQYQSSYIEYTKTAAQLKELTEQLLQAEAEADYHRFLFEELETARLTSNEQHALENELQQLEHAEEIKRNLLSVIFALREQDASIEQQLKTIQQQVQQAARYMPALDEPLSRLSSSIIEIRDLTEEFIRSESLVMHDGDRLNTVNERLNLIYALQQKHRVQDTSALIEIRNQLSEKLVSTSNLNEEISALEKKVVILEKQTRSLADQLTKSRHTVRAYLSTAVEQLLEGMGMHDSKLKITLDKTENGVLRLQGQDAISFFFSANKGQEPQPIGKVASGGELSRLMLAVKSIVAKSSALPTIIFDEIDTGISGEVALNVGSIMQKLAKNMQVIAITHLPQIAAKGNTHFKVHKTTEKDKTNTHISQLSADERIYEIAQMLSGANPGHTAIQHAAELLKA